MDAKPPKTVSRFREVLPQVLAMAAANLTVLDIAVTFFFSTLVIADLHNSDQELSMDDSQASWFGGLPYMCQPIGSIGSGFLVTWLGRKRSLMLIGIPYLIGCILINQANSIPVLFLSNVIIGITVGFTEAPINNYFGEVCQPELRSTLAGSAAIFYQFGMFLEFLLGSVMHWRTAAAVSTVVPILSFCLISRIPESPIWLVAQGRKKDAQSALCWLRGWVEPSAVQKELDDLVAYHDGVTLNSLPVKSGLEQELSSLLQIREKSKKESTFLAKTKMMLEPETRRPIILTFLIFVFSSMGGMFSIKPYFVGVLQSFKAPIDPKWSSVVVAAAGFLGSIFLVCVIRVMGKRALALSSTAVCAICCILLGLYAYLFIVPGDDSYLVATWVPLALFILLSFASAAQCQVPWLLVAEVFPFRTRGYAAGLSASFMYIVAFVASKTYLMTERAFELHGTFWFFGGVNVVCFIYMYFQLPETEGKSLEEIERIFARNKSRRSSAINYNNHLKSMSDSQI